MIINTRGKQTAIAETIRKRRADYVLALEGKQGTLEDIRLYFEDVKAYEKIKKGGESEQ